MREANPIQLDFLGELLFQGVLFISPVLNDDVVGYRFSVE